MNEPVSAKVLHDRDRRQAPRGWRAGRGRRKMH